MPDWARCSRRKRHRTRTRHGLTVTLELLRRAVTGIGIPGLEPAVNGVVGVIELIKSVRDNADDLHDLNDVLASLANAISSAPNLRAGAQVSAPLRSRVDGFLLGLHRMLIEVDQMLRVKNLVVRAANSKADREVIVYLNAKVHRLLNLFNAQGTLSLELDMANVLHNVQSVIQAQIAQEYENLIGAIPRVHARYNDSSTKPSRPCHPHTRIGLLQTIRAWIYADIGTTPYFWLCGEVGVGKTTVAYTVAQENEALLQLGASFFFSRDDNSRRTPSGLFTSIAYQLARYDQGFYKALAETLKPDPDIVKRTSVEQFKRLVLQPLKRSGIDSSRTIVIIIDGLDECSDPASILDVLTLGTEDVGVRLRVLISSRPHAAILSKFKDPRLHHLISEAQFHDVNPEVLSNDVSAYLSWELGAIASRWGLPSPWPPEALRKKLIQRAAGLFIIASSYTKYLENPEVGNPMDQLERILSRKKRLGSSPLAELDNLYDQVLDDLRLRLKSEVVIACDILGVIIRGRDKINVQILAGLLCVDPSDVRLILRHLTAVLLLPQNDVDPIVPFHASFGEYIQDSTRCTVRELLIDAEAADGRIAVRCSDAIASAASTGIIGVEYDCARGNSWVPAHLRHAASYLLDSYLPQSPIAQAEEAKKAIIKTETDMWKCLNIIFIQCTIYFMVHWIDLTGGFEPMLQMDGSSAAERSASLGRLMISDHIREINRVLEDAATTHKASIPAASEPWRRQALKFMVQSRNSSARGIALSTVRNVRCWMKYTHSNIMSFKGVDVKFTSRNISQEVLVFVASPISITRSSSLQGYLKRNDDLNMTSRVRLALGIADGLRYLHGSSPPQPHTGINPYQILVSSEGQPILYPSRWDLHFQSTAPLDENDNIDAITCHWEWNFSPPRWYHWSPTGRDKWQYSLEARLQVDVWDFGSILYQMATREKPLMACNRLARGNAALDKCLPSGYNISDGTWSDNPWNESLYEAAVLLLLNELEASEAIKELLKCCWTIQPQDRPPMSEVFERLKAIVEDMEM